MRNATSLSLALVMCLIGATALAAGANKKTCGQMTAEWASQPAALAGLANATAEHFERHAAIVGKGKHAGSAEVVGLKEISGHLRAAAKELTVASEGMKAAADWPSVPHDMKAMRADAANTAAREHEIAALQTASAEIQKALDFWNKVPASKGK
jgi:hypothetical protein